MGRATGAAVTLLLLPLAACQAGSQAPPVRATMISPSPPERTPAGATALPQPSGAPGPAGPPPVVAPAPSPPGTTHPANSIYLTQLHGYDASYPQCGARDAPAGAGFAVIGVNQGKAFTSNACLARLWRQARQPRALYVNSGFNPDNYPKAGADCQQLGDRVAGTTDQQRAYAIGCGEAVQSLAAAQAAGADSPEMYWIDVEVTNSWDELDLNLNRYALEGEIDQLVALGRPVGLYSTFRDWQAVSGGWSPSAITADWVAGRTPTFACSGPGFSGHQVWLAQEAATWPAAPEYDSDWAC